MAEGKAVPKIAVGPQGSADWACDAVRAGGGEVVEAPKHVSPCVEKTQ